MPKAIVLEMSVMTGSPTGRGHFPTSHMSRPRRLSRELAFEIHFVTV
jgi:hypothetical protein